MIPQYVKAVGQLQELFQELVNEGKITDRQAGRFDHSQKVLVNFHAWIHSQLAGSIHTELPWEEVHFTEAWNLWKKFKKEQFQFEYKQIGEQGALKDLVELSGGEMGKAIEIIHQSIKKGWKGFFELKEQKAITKKLVDQRQTDYKQQLMNRLGIE